MTKQLEKFFNLPESEPVAIKTDSEGMPDELTTEVKDALTTIEKIDNALEQVTNLDQTDKELDELATVAKDKFGDLVELAMGVEPRFSGPILQAASTLLGHSVTAKTAKIDRKMRTLELQLRKAKLEFDMTKKNKSDVPTQEDPIEGTARVIDRNELLSSIISEIKKNSKAGK